MSLGRITGLAFSSSNMAGTLARGDPGDRRADRREQGSYGSCKRPWMGLCETCPALKLTGTPVVGPRPVRGCRGLPRTGQISRTPRRRRTVPTADQRQRKLVKRMVLRQAGDDMNQVRCCSILQPIIPLPTSRFWKATGRWWDPRANAKSDSGQGGGPGSRVVVRCGRATT